MNKCKIKAPAQESSLDETHEVFVRADIDSS